jgi:glyoxylase-like metal-dependent hydrolase (beta-lactamase superfamily II)
MAAVKRLVLSIRALSNGYLVNHGGILTLIDAGTAGSSAKVLRAVEEIGRQPADVKQIVLTHCHGDHAGDALALKDATGAAVVAGAPDAEVLEGAAPYPGPRGRLARLLYGSLAGFPRFTPDVRVDGRTEIEGGLVVVPAPGHTAGHVAIFAPELGALFVGDTVKNLLGVAPFWKSFHQDPEENLRSIRLLSGIAAEQVYFGHGAPLMHGGSARLLALTGGGGPA